ncbi:hypothetical protein [Spiroplasma endosymbiont of Tipula paludosa]|uniref:hypothetical protein n=1 Tax=Spiroplasma endosymbiont of Tipula paludosa TaxID=3066295 RepID=UPI0035C8864E
MLDKYKDKNEFYSLVGIKCYSYVPSLIKFSWISWFQSNNSSLWKKLPAERSLWGA